MKVLIATFALFYFIYFASSEKQCTPDDCKAPNCTCLSYDPPYNHTKDDIPQFIIMTFDEAVRITNFEIYANLSNFKNPNGCPIQATFFVSHVDTNYKLVHDLHRRGHEIAAHSISKNPSSEVWKKMNLTTWREEMGGIKRIISHLAEVPIDEIIGARAPGLQTAGNITFTALNDEGFRYDCSMPSRKGTVPTFPKPLFPYTLDYGFQRFDDCQIKPCLEPGQNYSGFWTVPMNDWVSKLFIPETNTTIDRECASVDACIMYKKDGTLNDEPTVEQIVELFEQNFKRFYERNRAPFPLFLREAWLSANANRQKALIQFIDKITKDKNVFFVSISEVIDWMERGQNATSIHDYTQSTCAKEPKKTSCMVTDIKTIDADGKICKYLKVPQLNGQDKTMVICDRISCPPHYPWVGNDAGN